MHIHTRTHTYMHTSMHTGAQVCAHTCTAMLSTKGRSHCRATGGEDAYYWNQDATIYPCVESYVLKKGDSWGVITHT